MGLVLRSFEVVVVRVKKNSCPLCETRMISQALLWKHGERFWSGRARSARHGRVSANQVFAPNALLLHLSLFNSTVAALPPLGGLLLSSCISTLSARFAVVAGELAGDLERAETLHCLPPGSFHLSRSWCTFLAPVPLN